MLSVNLDQCVYWGFIFWGLQFSLILQLLPSVLFLLQSLKLREVFNLDHPYSNFLLKNLTIVSGSDMVDLTFHNFVSYKENISKVSGPEVLEVLGSSKDWGMQWRVGKERRRHDNVR